MQPKVCRFGIRNGFAIEEPFPVDGLHPVVKLLDVEHLTSPLKSARIKGYLMVSQSHPVVALLVGYLMGMLTDKDTPQYPYGISEVIHKAHRSHPLRPLG